MIPHGRDICGHTEESGVESVDLGRSGQVDWGLAVNHVRQR